MKKLPLAVRVLMGVGIGVALGIALGTSGTPTMGDVGFLVIRFLKALAAPLILFAVVDALLRTSLPGRKGALLLAISAGNAVVAIAIGLGLANLLQSGRGAFAGLHPAAAQTAKKMVDDAAEPTLDPLKNVMSYVPENLVDPFRRNAVITIVLLAILLGVAMRAVRASGSDQARRGIAVVEDVVHAGLQVFTRLLAWIVELVPFAVLGVVAAVVGKSGWQVLLSLAPFLGTMLLGLFLHAVVYYSFLLFSVARVSPLRFFAGAADAIVTALSASSSLATLPVTLRVLDENLKVSPSSARLAACVGTNLNHDGIILYEACATLFVAQAFGYELSAGQQVTVALSSVMAGVGIAGVPEAGLITLPLVLSAAGLPAEVVALVVPLILPVDWIIGRCRAATNVISDMTVATILDRLAPTPAAPAGDAAHPS